MIAMPGRLSIENEKGPAGLGLLQHWGFGRNSTQPFRQYSDLQSTVKQNSCAILCDVVRFCSGLSQPLRLTLMPIRRALL
jgi:hypothetical protein